MLRPRPLVGHATRSSSVSLPSDVGVSPLGLSWPICCGTASPRRAAERTITAYVSQLRSAYGSLVETRPGGYILSSGVRVDEDEFVDLDARARAADVLGDTAQAVAEWADALALWRGPFLGSFADCDWAQGSAVRMNEYRLDVVERRADALRRLSRASEAIGELDTPVAEHPARESLLVLLMPMPCRLRSPTRCSARVSTSDHVSPRRIGPLRAPNFGRQEQRRSETPPPWMW